MNLHLASPAAELINTLQADVEVVDAIAAQVGEIARSITGLLIARIGKTIGIDIGLLILRCVVNANTGRQGLAIVEAGKICPLIAICEPRITHRYRKWLSSLETGKRRQLPSPYQRIHGTVHL